MTFTDPVQQIEALKAELEAAKASEKAAMERAQIQYREMRVAIRTAEKLELELHRQAAEAKGKAGRQADALLYFKWRLEETEAALAANMEALEQAKAANLQPLEKAKAKYSELWHRLEKEKEKYGTAIELSRQTSTSWEKMRKENEQLKQDIASLQARASPVVTLPQKRTAALAADGDLREPFDMGPPRKFRRLQDDASNQQRKWTKQQQTSTLNGRSPYAYDPSLPVPTRSPSSPSSPSAQMPSPLSTARSREVTMPSSSPSAAPGANRSDRSKGATASPHLSTHTLANSRAPTVQSSADVPPAKTDGQVTASFSAKEDSK